MGHFYGLFSLATFPGTQRVKHFCTKSARKKIKKNHLVEISRPFVPDSGPFVTLADPDWHLVSASRMATILHCRLFEEGSPQMCPQAQGTARILWFRLEVHSRLTSPGAARVVGLLSHLFRLYFDRVLYELINGALALICFWMSVTQCSTRTRRESFIAI